MKNARDEQIIAALMNYPTVREAAKQCGTCERQIYKRLEDATFASRYAAARRELLEASVKALQAHLGDAVKTLVLICNDAKNAPQVRINAADAIIRNALKLTEMIEFDARLTALENIHGTTNQAP